MRLLPSKKKPYQSSLTSELLLRSPVKSEGLLKAEDDMFIDTEHHGDIRTMGHLTIGPNAILKGNVQARAISVQGSILGNIKASETVVLEGGSSLSKAGVMGRDVIVQSGCQLTDVKITTKS